MLHLVSIVLALQTQWLHWCCHEHHKMLVLMILHNQKSHIPLCHWWCHWSCMILIQVPIASHNSKGHVAHHFNYLSLMNAMLLLASCDTSSSGVVWPKSHVTHWFGLLNWTNKIVPLTVPFMTLKPVPRTPYDWKSCYTSFWLPWPNKHSGVIVVSRIMWCQC